MSAYSKCTNATRKPARRLWKLRADGDDADRVPSATLKLADGVRKVRARAGLHTRAQREPVAGTGAPGKQRGLPRA